MKYKSKFFKYYDQVDKWLNEYKIKPENIISITSAYNDRAGHGYVIYYVINK